MITSDITSFGAGGLSYQWFNDTSDTPNAIAGANLSSYNSTGGAIGSFIYYLVINDVEDNNAVSNNALVIVNTTTTTAGGGIGGGGGASTSGGGGGGGSVTSVTIFSGPGNETGHTIYNFTQGGTVNFVINNKTFTVTLNFIGPNDAGVTINGHSYTLSVGSVTLLNDPAGWGYFAELISLGYLPVLHWINMTVFGAPLVQPGVASTTSTASTSSVETIASTTMPTTSTTHTGAAPVQQAAASSASALTPAEATAIVVAIALAAIIALLYRRWVAKKGSGTEKEAKWRA